MQTARKLGERAPTVGRPLRQFGVGRVCPTCGATLSRYNQSLFCSIHQPKTFVTLELTWELSAPIPRRI
jgi:hypothetical protein